MREYDSSLRGVDKTARNGHNSHKYHGQLGCIEVRRSQVCESTPNRDKAKMTLSDIMKFQV